MNILIFGGNGFIGTNLCIQLINAGYNVTSFDISQPKDIYLVNHKNYLFIPHNISDTSQLETKLNEINGNIAILLTDTLLPTSDFNKFYSDISINLLSIIRTIDILQKRNITKVIYFSSGGTIYGNLKNGSFAENSNLNPSSFYAWQKVSIEYYLKMLSTNSDFQYLILRASNPYGKYQDLTKQQGLIPHILYCLKYYTNFNLRGDGETIRDYIYIEDLCEICNHLILANKWNETFNIGRGIGVSINQLISICEKITNKQLRIKISQEFKTDLRKNILNISKLKENLPVINFTSIESGISKYWNNTFEEQ